MSLGLLEGVGSRKGAGCLRETTFAALRRAVLGVGPVVCYCFWATCLVRTLNVLRVVIVSAMGDTCESVE